MIRELSLSIFNIIVYFNFTFKKKIINMEINEKYLIVFSNKISIE